MGRNGEDGGDREGESRPKPGWTGRIATLLLLLGVALLIAVAAQYGYMAERQAELRAEWRMEARRPVAPPDTALSEISAARLTGPLRLVIPSIDLDDMVARGDNYRALLAGPGWMPGTAAPGTDGNLVIAGHRDTFFRHVHELRPGDVVEVQRAGRSFRYAVVSRRVIKPSDTGVLAPTPDAELTLVTCYPTYWVGPAPDRLIVRARLVPGG